MATDGPVMRFNNIDYAASDERLLMSVMLGALGGGPFSARSGKRPGTGLNATVSGLNVTVTPGPGVIYDASYASAGPYLFANTANRTIPLGDGVGVRPGAGQKRIDLIVARITDPLTVGGTAEMKIVRVPGTAAPTPSAPALPPLSMEVARAEVPASGAVILTLSSARTVAAGGILPVATTTERDSLPSPHTGLAVYVEADDQIYVFGPNGWRVLTATDPAFTNLTVFGTYEVPSFSDAPAAKLMGGYVFLSGAFIRIDRGNIGADFNPGSIPSALRPDKERHLIAAGAGGAMIRIRILPNTGADPGIIKVHAAPTFNTSLLILDGLFYRHRS